MRKRVDPRLKDVLQAFARTWRAKRSAAFQGLDFEKLRTDLASARDAALDRWDALRAEFEDNARRQGSVVLHAATGAQANVLIRDILRGHRFRTLVKTKSMVSEETGLNRFLEKSGLRPRETDLGEWIVQLAGAAPTHMVMPAIHLTRRGVAAIFERALGRAVAPDIPELVRTAREELRGEIFKSGAGLTGANALIAENGAIMLVTNEGNGRLVTTVPPVHIVLASLDKLVATTREALLLLKLLTRSATGQPLSSYVSFIAGPHHEAQYIVLLDNHRSEIRDSPVFRPVLRCIKCSACLNVCPVYQVVGGERFSHVYMGGIGGLLTSWIHGLRHSRALADLCLVCHRCEEVCPTRIEIAGLVRALRERLVSEMGVPVWKEIVLDQLVARPAAYQSILGLGRRLGPVISGSDGFARRLPPPLKKYDRFRALPAPARETFSALMARRSRPVRVRESRGEVLLFAGCLVEHFYPSVGLDACRVLEALGYVVRPAPAGCCGFPSANSGFRRAAGKAFSGLIPGLAGDRPIITLCPTCTTMLARTGPEILDADEAWKTGRRVVAFSQFLKRLEPEALAAIRGPAGSLASITYHDSCHHGFVLRAGRDSREVLETTRSGAIVEMERPDSCCGFAGTYAVSHPEVSEALLADKVESIKATGAGTVALDCPGCLLQIRGGCRRAGLKVEVRHTAEILARGIRHPARARQPAAAQRRSLGDPGE
jgi:iron-sulfur cluster protein